VTTTAAATGTRHYTDTYPADPAQVRQARAALAALLHNHPLAADAILISSEFATNSVVHSVSRHGGEFTLRAEIHPDHIRIEVEDAGGPWLARPREDGRPHGFDVVQAITGPQNWGVDGDARSRTAWARLTK
jgi:anti-sigma regulatory factor (Ser/Thr protein kinase)